MKVLFHCLVALMVGASLLMAACGQPASAPTPAPTQPVKAAEPTKAPAAPAAPTAAPTAAPVAPTAVPAKKVDFPQKGKPITLIVPYAAGGPTDVAARLLAAVLEPELGTPVQVVNKAGAGSQIGLTEMATSKPDGYTMAYAVIPAANTVYLDPERKSVFGRKDVLPIAVHDIEPNALRVPMDSPIKTVKDFVDTGKANPEKLKVGITGILGPPHLSIIQLQIMTGAKYGVVVFDGSGPATTALLGGHVDAQVGMTSDAFDVTKVRTVGIMDSQKSRYYPDVPTFEAQGYKLIGGVVRTISLPAGTPQEVVDILSAALKKAMTNPDHVKKMDTIRQEVQYMGPAETAKLWDQWDEQLKPLVEASKTLK